MRITGFEKFDLKPLYQGFTPFFDGFKKELSETEKNQIIASILEQSATLISKEIERQKSIYKSFKEND